MLFRSDLIPSSTKRVKLEDEKPIPIPHLTSTTNASDEKQTCRNPVNEDSNPVKSSINPVSVHKEDSSLVETSTNPAVEVKSDNNRDVVPTDSKSKYIKSDDTAAVTSKNEVNVKNGSTEAGSVAASSRSARHGSSEKTSHRHHHHDRRHWRSGCSAKPESTSSGLLDYELRRSCYDGSKYGSLMHVETHPNGGASVLHAFEDELSALSPRELSEFVREFFHVVFAEEPAGVPHFVIGIVHNSAAYLPDILEYFVSARPDMVVKRSQLGKPLEMETLTMAEYFQLVHSTYLAGTYRTGPLDHFSIVGTKAEETGGYFPQFLDLLEQNVFLRYVSPWGRMSELENMPRNESNDGPIVWARPGEQVVPTADMPKSPMVKKR